jgi:DNA-directed RNA polymerase subunit L
MSFKDLVITTEAGDASTEHGSGPKIMKVVAIIPLSVVNAVRRTVMSDVVTIAIAVDDITVLKNTTILHNEMISQRLSSTPPHIDAKMLDHWQKQAPYTFSIEEKNDGSVVKIVTSKDINVFDAATRRKVDDAVRDKMFPPSPVSGDHVVIVYLSPRHSDTSDGDSVNVEFVARRGTGRERASWNLTSSCFFRNVIDTEAFEKALVEKSLKATGGEPTDAERSQFAALDGQRFYKRDKHGEASEFEMIVHCETCLSPVYLIEKAFDILIAKIERLATQFDESKRDAHDGSVTIGEGELIEGCMLYHVHVNDEDDTIGNMVQSLLYRHWLGGAGSVVNFIGYNIAHPQERRVTFKIVLVDPETDLMPVVHEGLLSIRGDLQDLLAEWKALSVT